MRRHTLSSQLPHSTVSIQFNSTCTHTHTHACMHSITKSDTRHVAKVFNWTPVRMRAVCGLFRGGARNCGCNTATSFTHCDACGKYTRGTRAQCTFAFSS